MPAAAFERLTGSMTTTTNPYATNPYAAAPSRGLSITSFVLGLGSVVFSWTFIAPVAGLVFGILALRREPQGKTFAIWGIVLSALMLAGVLFALVLAVAGVGFGLAFLPFAFL